MPRNPSETQQRDPTIITLSADWSDSKILWVRADFGVGGDGSVISTNWFSLSFKPSTLIASPDLQTVYVANKVRPFFLWNHDDQGPTTLHQITAK